MAQKIRPVSKEDWELVNEENRELTDNFLNQLHLSPHTLRQYTSAAKIFFRWVKENVRNKPIYELKVRDGMAYQNYLISLGLSSNAIKFKRSVVSSMCGYYEVFYGDEHPLFRNIFNKQVPNVAKENVREKIPMTKEEYELLISELEKREEWQMLAFLKFTYSSGCRKGEVAQLLKEVAHYKKAKDKDGNDKTYYLTHNIRTKGRGAQGKVRKLKFDESARQAILKWLDVRGEDDEPQLFVKKTKDGKVTPLSPNAFNHWCAGLFSVILGREIWVHLIRSTRATHIVVYEGKDIKTAQSVLGHQDSSTTEIYVVRDDSADADDAFE